MKTKTIKVLSFEDSPQDLLLLEHALEQDAFNHFKLTHVERLQDGLKVLKRRKFDAILLDLDLPDSHGLATFEQVLQQSNETPIVICSGNIDESDAVTAVRNGAQDYLVKGMAGFAFAPRTIRYAIERRKLAQTVQESEARYHSLFDHGMDAILLGHPQGEILAANSSACQLFGYSEAELRRIGRQGLMEASDPCWQSALAEREQTGFFHGELTFKRRDGSTFVGEISSNIFADKDGLPTTSILIRDTTERKQAEAGLRLHGEVMANMSEGVVLIRAADLSITYTNPKFDAMFGYDAGELVGEKIWILNAPTQHDPVGVAREIENTLKETGVWNGEVQNIRKNGEKFWCSANISRLDHPQYGMVWVTVQTDITERKQAEEKLRESEARFAKAFTASPFGTVLLDLPGQKICDINPAGLEIWGFTREEVLGKTTLELNLAVNPQQRSEKQAETARMGKLSNVETRMRRKDGEIRDLILSAVTIEVNGLPYLLTLFIDITERVRADEKLRESEERLELVMEGSQLGYWDWDIETGVVHRNARWAEMLGYTLEELQLNVKQWTDLHHPDDKAAAWKSIQDHLEGKTPAHRVEYRMRTKDGQYIWILDQARVVKRDPQGKPLRMSGTHTDITERKLAEEKLERARKMLADAQMIAHLGSFEYVAATQTTAWSEEEYHIYGLDPAGPSPEYEVMLQKCIHPDDAALLHETFTKAMQSNSIYELEHRIVRPDGSMRWVYALAHPNINEQGELIGYVGTTLDITERKLAEEKLADSERRFRSLIEHSSDGIVLLAADGSLIYESTAVQRINGYPAEERIGKNSFELIHPEDQQLVKAKFAELLRQPGQVVHATYRSIRKDGSIWWTESTASNLLADPSVQSIVVNFRDVTERKNTEAKNQESEERLRLSLGAANQGLYDLNVQTGEAIVNSEYVTILGYDADTFVETNQAWIERLHPDDREVVTKVYQDYIAGKRPEYRVEFRQRTKDGSWKWILSLGKLVAYDTEGRPLRMLGTHTDITERKQAEEALRKSQANLETAQAIAHVGSWVLDIPVGQLTWSAETFRIFDLPERASLPLDEFFARIHPDDLAMVHSAWSAALQGKPYDIEHRILRPDGHVRWVHELAEVTFGADGTPLLGIGTAQDVTERKRAEALIFAQRDLAHAVGRFSTAREGYQVCLETVFNLTGLDSGGIYIFDEDRLNLNLVHHHGWGSDFIESVSHFPREAHNVRLILSGAPVYLPYTHPVFETELYRQEGLKTLGSIPILYQDQVVGCLNLGSHTLVEMPDYAQRVLEALAIEVGNFAVYLRAQESLRSSEEQYRRLSEELEERVRERAAEVLDLYDNAPTGYHSLDTNGYFVKVNQTELNWLGYTRNELIGHSFTDFITKDSLTVFRENFPVFKQRGWVRDLEFEMVRKDGSAFPVLINATTICDEQKNFVMSRSTVFDNTERKLAEQTLRESAEQNRLLFESSPDAVVLFDAEGRIVRMNHSFETLSGLSTGQGIGQTIDTLGLLPPEQTERLANAVMQSLLQTNEYSSVDIKIQRRSGELRNVSARVYGLLLQGRQHFLASMRDITAEKQAEDAVRLANVELERTLRMKDEFLANMSHELRTPLNAILGLSESLLEETAGPLNDKQMRYLGTVSESGKHLLELINDILDLAKVESGQIRLELQNIDVQGVCDASLRMVKQLAQKKNQTVSLEIAGNIGLVRADERRLKQMLVNLLSNAVKFTPENGRLGLEARLDPEAAHLLLTVWDEGIGIAEQDLKRLFQPFVQLDSRLSRESAGTGLGLALVAEMARLHGGSIQVVSAPGHGSRFILTLPWEPDLELDPGERLKTTGHFHPLTERAAEERQLILLVEDTDHVVMMVSDYLELAGYNVEVARNGLDGVTRARALHPALIIMDVQMPGMDGLEATRRIRQEPGFQNIPILALTALAMPSDRERCLAAGMNDYISKPVNLKQLVRTIGLHLAKNTDSGT